MTRFHEICFQSFENGVIIIATEFYTHTMLLVREDHQWGGWCGGLLKRNECPGCSSWNVHLDLPGLGNVNLYNCFTWLLVKTVSEWLIQTAGSMCIFWCLKNRYHPSWGGRSQKTSIMGLWCSWVNGHF